jgi:DNA-binding XRE family transcriptional regulator
MHSCYGLCDAGRLSNLSPIKFSRRLNAVLIITLISFCVLKDYVTEAIPGYDITIIHRRIMYRCSFPATAIIFIEPWTGISTADYQHIKFDIVRTLLKNSFCYVYYRDDKFLKKFGAHLKTIRTEKGISQEKLANELNFSQPHIAKIESGEVNTSISHAAAFARALKIPVSSLFDF